MTVQQLTEKIGHEDAYLILKDNYYVSLKEGDIVIKSSASFKEILDVLILHAKQFLEGEYTESKILDELFRSRLKKQSM